MPYRMSTPPDPEPQELEDPYAAVLRGQRRRARSASAVVMVFCAAGLAKVAHSHQQPAPHKAPRSEAARLDGARSAIAGARARAAEQQVRFEDGVREAIAADAVQAEEQGRDAAPSACPVALPSAPSLVRGRPAFPLLVVGRDELRGTLPSQAIAEVLADTRRAEGHLAAGRFEEATLYARALDREERFRYDVVLVTKENKPVRALSESTFEPGAIEGRAYVYDFASGKVVCRGDVRAKSSRAIGYMYSDRTDTPPSLGPSASMDDAIREDLRRETERAILTAFRP